MKGSDDQAAIRKRLQEGLKRLQELGMTQAEVARCVGVASQYLSDVKSGRKPVTKLFALRLRACYGLDDKWLMRGGDPPAHFFELDLRPDLQMLLTELSVFDAPIIGDPESHPNEAKLRIDLAGPAAQHAYRAKEPYLLRFVGKDPEGGLRQNDLILISQNVNRTAKIQVVRQQTDLVLARKIAQGVWQRVDNGQSLRRKVEAVGSCVAIVWRQL
jgi:transcriptional regulator with XRE-family HTH domain